MPGRGSAKRRTTAKPRKAATRLPSKAKAPTAAQLKAALGEALEQQEATSEILRVISRSPDDVQPVFDAIAARALQLCGARFSTCCRFDGELIHLAAFRHLKPRGLAAFRAAYPQRPGRSGITARAILMGKVVHVGDVLSEPEYVYHAAAKAANYRSVLAVPMLRNGRPIGAVSVFGAAPQLFPDAKVQLLKTFADQAVIAIENARLFNETKEALDQQTATAEILQAISSSPGNLQPVFDTLVGAAARFCGAPDVAIMRLEGDVLRAVAATGQFAQVLKREAGSIEAVELPFNRGSVSGRAASEQRTVHIHDLAVESEEEYPIGREMQRRFGHHSTAATPLLREGRPLGVIVLFRTEVRPFSDKQLQLLRIFADQAVIAIENVRLFRALESRNRDLTEALEQQTATSGILRVISRSPTDVQPVFDTIVSAALKLCTAHSATVLSLEGQQLRLAALAIATPEGADAVRSLYPRPVGRDSAAGRAVLARKGVAITDVLEDREYTAQSARARATAGFRSVVSMPLLRDGIPIGAINVGRHEPGPFPDAQISLLQTFADQAVIAIENVRLFKELEVRNRDLTEALEQQTATSDILRIISRSPTDVQPVFETIVKAALSLCRAHSATVLIYDGGMLHVGARLLDNATPEEFDAIRGMFPRAPGRDTAAGRAIITRRIVVIPDVMEDGDYEDKSAAIRGGFRSAVAIPLMRDGSPIGTINIGMRHAGAFPEKQLELLQTFADQAVIAIENVRLFKELEARNRDLTEALEQQTATAEILRAISRSPTDVQPVFDAIVQSAVRLCDGDHGIAVRFDGELLHPLAYHGFSAEALEILARNFPMRPSPGTTTQRVVLTAGVVNIPDTLADPSYSQEYAVAGGFRSTLGVPMLRDGKLIGAIGVGREKPGAFSDRFVTLLKTFADQAVIAIENVRLFKALEARNRDLTEALEHQTATGEILRVISSSPTDVQPVFDIIGERAAKLCEAEVSVVTRVESERIHLAAVHGVNSDAIDALTYYFPANLSAGSASARAFRNRAPAHIPDVVADPEYDSKDIAMAGGWRSCLAVPMLREGQVIGTIFVGRKNPGLFPESKVELLKTFADQAVIAIENVRLFTELGVRNRDLTEALEQQTATSEILSVISKSQTDVQPVFDTIAKAARELCRATSANVFTYDGELVHAVAVSSPNAQYVETIHQIYPRKAGRDTGVARAIQSRAVVIIPDVLADEDYVVALGAHATAGGFRSVLAVPLMREGRAIGGIAVGRAEAGPFPDAQVALLKTFADQAVIAIENVRLFNELKARTAELTRSVGELKALGEVGQAVSSTLDLETVLRTIVSRATELAGMDGGSIWEYDEAREEFHVHATDRLPADLVEILRTTPIRKGEGALGKLALTSEPVAIRDFADERTYKSRLRNALIRSGFHSVFAVPLLRDNHLLGALAVNRRAPGEFDEALTGLLKTFATQSAVAIQNARLFREIELKSRELETASRHKSEFLANMSHELRTPLNAIIGFSEVLAEKMFGEVNPKQAEYLADILESGRHLLSLINDILDLSKIEAGRMELETSEFDLPAAIENALILVRERAQRRAIKLSRDVDERLGKIHGDERKVKQVLLNLLSNALKFTPEGGRVDVRAARRNGLAEISVSDTGVGIAPEDQAAVFEEFRQVGTASKKVEGTGLGLAISRKFIELHGGRMWVESEVGKGATFSFTLPQGS